MAENINNDVFPPLYYLKLDVNLFLRESVRTVVSTKPLLAEIIISAFEKAIRQEGGDNLAFCFYGTYLLYFGSEKD